MAIGKAVIWIMATTNEALRERLEQDRVRLLDEIESLAYLHSIRVGTDTENDYYGNHMADVGTETFEHEKDLALETNLRRQLQMTEEAIRRYDQGVYGICSNCGQPINPERLEALPQATLCIRCKTRQEAQH